MPTPINTERGEKGTVAQVLLPQPCPEQGAMARSQAVPGTESRGGSSHEAQRQAAGKMERAGASLPVLETRVASGRAPEVCSAVSPEHRRHPPRCPRESHDARTAALLSPSRLCPGTKGPGRPQVHSRAAVSACHCVDRGDPPALAVPWPHFPCWFGSCLTLTVWPQGRSNPDTDAPQPHLSLALSWQLVLRHLTSLFPGCTLPWSHLCRLAGSPSSPLGTPCSKSFTAPATAPTPATH